MWQSYNRYVRFPPIILGEHGYYLRVAFEESYLQKFALSLPPSLFPCLSVSLSSYIHIFTYTYILLGDYNLSLLLLVWRCNIPCHLSVLNNLTHFSPESYMRNSSSFPLFILLNISIRPSHAVKYTWSQIVAWPHFWGFDISD